MSNLAEVTRLHDCTGKGLYAHCSLASGLLMNVVTWVESIPAVTNRRQLRTAARAPRRRRRAEASKA